MDVPLGLPAAPPRRRYVRRKPPSPEELAARRANLAKPRAAPRELHYRPTAKRRAASRANLQKAIAARKSPRGNAVDRLSLEHLERRADALTHLLFDYEELFREGMKAHSQVERALRELLLQRSGGKVQFKCVCPLREMREEFSWVHAWERWESLTPVEREDVLRRAGLKSSEWQVGSRE